MLDEEGGSSEALVTELTIVLAWIEAGVRSSLLLLTLFSHHHYHHYRCQYHRHLYKMAIILTIIPGRLTGTQTFLELKVN